MPDKINSFTDLNAWREGHKLVLFVYKVTKTFPSDEKFGLASQLQKAVVSITSNIAEGFSRSTSKDKINFYRTALGSLAEVQNQLLIARDLNYLYSPLLKTSAFKLRMKASEYILRQQGSLNLEKLQLLSCRSLSKSDFDLLAPQTIVISKLINGLIKSLNKPHDT